MNDRSQRTLYNQDFLDADCNANIVALNEQNGVDSSVATFATNYLLAAIMLLYAIFSAPQKGDKEHSGMMICLYFVSTGLAFGIAGIGHQITDEQEEVLNQYILRIVAFFTNVGTFCLIRLVILYLRTFQGITRTVWWILAVIVTVCGVVTAVKNPLVSGGPGLFSIIGILFVHLWQWMKSKSIMILCKALAIILLLVGGLIQIFLSPVCGYNGYPDCFRDCPLPAPHFNHNALFHVLALLCYALYGFAELRLPAQDCLSILRVVPSAEIRLDDLETTRPPRTAKANETDVDLEMT